MKWRTLLGLSCLFFLGAFYPYSSPVRDAVTEQLAKGYHWHFPWTYVLFTPFCSMADYLTVLSMKEMLVFLVYSLTACACLPARKRTKGASLLLFLVFLGWVGLVPRAMERLVADDADCLLID